LDKSFITDSRAHHRERFTPKIEPTFLVRPEMSPHAVSRTEFNSGESGRSAGLMRTRDPCADVEGFEFDRFERRDLAGRLENDELGSGSGARSATERAILEMSVRFRMVVMAMMGRHTEGARHRRCRRTQFQQERSAAGRHETDRHIRPQHQHCQQNAGQYVVSPTVERRWFHDCGPTMPDRIPGHQWENYEVRPEHAAGKEICSRIEKYSRRAASAQRG
jgi:hypothetical protein